MNKVRHVTIILACMFLLLSMQSSFAGSMGTDYLLELGISYYERGDYENALTEFKKALILDPDDETAIEYIGYIEEETSQRYAPPQPSQHRRPTAVYRKPSPAQLQRDAEPQPQQYAQPERYEPPQKQYKKPSRIAAEPAREQTNWLKLSGQLQASVGLQSDDGLIWRRANPDLNEKNWRMRSTDVLNNAENTFDPRIFQRLRVNVDTQNEYGPGFHTTVMIDPWSYVGQTDTVTLTGSGGDIAKVRLKTFGSTRYTLNETYYNLNKGLIANVPEIKTHGNRTSETVITDAWGNTMTIPELKIDQQFQPMRELWFDYKQENILFRIYPFGYENQAVTLNDPLTISGRRTWWEESPWIRQWRPGVFHAGNTPVDFTKGYWDNSLTFGVKDSDGSRLTLLRGVTLDMGSKEETRLIASVASSKDPWQAYSDYDNAVTANRITQKIGDGLIVGATMTGRMGFNAEEKNKTDARNVVGAADATAELTPGLTASIETAASKSSYDLTSSEYRTEKRGSAYFVSLIGRSGGVSILDAPGGFNGIKPEKGETMFTKWRLLGAHMDEGFDPTLSSYRETRDDEFWSRHIHFRKPHKFYAIGFYDTFQTFDDIAPFAVGDGIDVGRDVLGLRIESALWDAKVENLFDVRNVHRTDGKIIETAGRDELSVKLTDKLTFKGLALYQAMPKTHAGIDPFVTDPLTDRPYTNDWINDNTDPSIKTGSVGLNYDFFDWLSLNGTWEHTNDYYLGYDGFPRTILSANNHFTTDSEYGRYYRSNLAWLYDQGYFPNAPYASYDIFKAGLRYAPFDNLEMYFSYTRNEYEKAGAVDDNINHSGVEIYYAPFAKLRTGLIYQYSRWQDLDLIAQGDTRMKGHHNFFADLMYLISKDQDLTLQFGEASRAPVFGEIISTSRDPYSGNTWRCLDTEHIIRLFYRLRF